MWHHCVASALLMSSDSVAAQGLTDSHLLTGHTDHRDDCDDICHLFSPPPDAALRVLYSPSNGVTVAKRLNARLKRLKATDADQYNRGQLVVEEQCQRGR